jgi:hypothetical protein
MKFSHPGDPAVTASLRGVAAAATLGPVACPTRSPRSRRRKGGGASVDLGQIAVVAAVYEIKTGKVSLI